MADKINPIRPTTSEAIALARSLIANASFGALGVLDIATSAPHVTRVAVGTDGAGVPVILVSQLSHHTQCLLKDPRCSLLLGEPGRGDPLAHPRITLACEASAIASDDPGLDLISSRFLAAHPKAKLYITFSDFSFFRLSICSAALNGGFGRAFILGHADITDSAHRHVSKD